MNISSEISPTDESNSSDYLFFNDTEVGTQISVVYIISVLLGFPTNSYVIWLIVTGTGNGLAAEFFSLNLSVCEILLCLNSFLHLLPEKGPNLIYVILVTQGLGNTGRLLFQCVICFERYLAVIRPVTFLKFKPLRYRVICSVIVWVATFGCCVVIFVLFISFRNLFLGFILAVFIPILSIQLFCLSAVLRALKKSAPGERGREREEKKHMKRRAFYIILIITVTMVIIYAPFVISLLLFWNSTENTGVVIYWLAKVYNTAASHVVPVATALEIPEVPALVVPEVPLLPAPVIPEVPPTEAPLFLSPESHAALPSRELPFCLPLTLHESPAAMPGPSLESPALPLPLPESPTFPWLSQIPCLAIALLVSSLPASTPIVSCKPIGTPVASSLPAHLCLYFPLWSLLSLDPL
ncbi:C-C chemokine receptor type 2-like [Myxocyprinus asiaticus]|uniref:C-C chemokine receptor type 2-like n=1 Tax=Myxocyprinus asiaticus TaxID=70543 RepID=UPI002222A8EF|nr:C-C chemokine receptor type 2-like [Myxocyprinus asiaticus]